MATKTMDQYVTDAKKQLQGTYDNLKGQSQVNYNNQTNTYNQQKVDTGAGFDKQVQTNKTNGVVNQNQYNNNTLSRGLGRSSIATTGLAGIQNETNRAEADLLASKENELAKIETLKSQLKDSFNTQMLGYDKEMESKALALAQELKQYDDTLAQQLWEREFKEKQAAEDKRRWELEYALQKAASGGGGGGGGGYRRSGGSGGSSSKSSSPYAKYIDNKPFIFTPGGANGGYPYSKGYSVANSSNAKPYRPGSTSSSSKASSYSGINSSILNNPFFKSYPAMKPSKKNNSSNKNTIMRY